jgi:hypothetical protein
MYVKYARTACIVNGTNNRINMHIVSLLLCYLLFQQTVEDTDSGPIPYEYQRCIKTYSILMAATQAHYSLSQNCLHSLLQINRNLIQSFAALTGNAMLLKVAESIPNNIDQMTKVAGLNCNTFETYAVCTTCSNIYKEDTLCQENNSELEGTIKCNKVQFPEHPLISKRKPCGAAIAIRKSLQSGTTSIKLLSTYAYQSVASGLARLLPRLANEFLPIQASTSTPDLLFDIVDASGIQKQVRKYVCMCTYMHKVQSTEY